MKKRLLQRLAMLLLAFTLIPHAAWALTGKGTETNPYCVEYGSDLFTIRREIHEGKWKDGVHIKLVNDIVVGNWDPMGNDTYPFTGKLEGNKEIKEE